jgi:hypothetical protein
MRKLTTICAIALMCLTSCEKDTFIGFEPIESEVFTANETDDDSSDVTDEEQPIDDAPTDFPPVSETKIPAEWGEIIEANVSAIPADDETSNRVDKKILVVVTSKGAALVPFSRDTQIPSEEAIINANFIEGNFKGCDSGVYKDGKWQPARAVDSEDRLEYLVDGVCKRNLRFTTLESVSWDWQNTHEGGFSTHVSQYDVVVENNQFFIFVNGEQVFELR